MFSSPYYDYICARSHAGSVKEPSLSMLRLFASGVLHVKPQRQERNWEEEIVNEDVFDIFLNRAA